MFERFRVSLELDDLAGNPDPREESISGMEGYLLQSRWPVTDHWWPVPQDGVPGARRTTRHGVRVYTFECTGRVLLGGSGTFRSAINGSRTTAELVSVGSCSSPEHAPLLLHCPALSG